MTSPRTKNELSAYLSLLYFSLEREQVSEPDTVVGLRAEVKTLKERCIDCGVDVPPFGPDVVRLFGGE
jgi:hypothetical protein